MPPSRKRIVCHSLSSATLNTRWAKPWPTCFLGRRSAACGFSAQLKTQNYRPPEERELTFSAYPGYKASNPVVSDDGRFIAFQLVKSREAAGVGHGIFVLDLEKARLADPGEGI